MYAYFIHNVPFAGWAPIMMLLLIIGGLIMLMLGVLGEYVWRVFDEVKGRPVYIVDKEI
jgi:dolichol-phosphate mannosyltransferase